VPVALEARRSLPGLRVRPQPGDLIAGLSVALILIPQSLALADLAGLPAYHGLYAAVLPLLVAAFFVSSPYLQTGPVAITSLLTFGALSSMALAKSPDFVALAALLAIVVGLARVGLGLARAGFLAHFMSHAVLVGFTTGAAILIIASQLPTALGAPAPAGKLLVRAWWALSYPGSWELASIALGGLTIVLVLGGRRLHALFPGVLVAVAIGLAFSLLTGYTGPSVGAIPSGLPPFTLDLPWRALPALLVPGGVIALVGFAEPAAIARTFAAQDRQRWSPDREFISQGMANLAAGVSGGFPVGGSFGRSFVTRLAGGKTRWSGAITGLAVLAFLPVAGVLAALPRAILGAIIIAAVVKLVQLASLAGIWRFSKPQALIAWLTFAATLVLAPRIDYAVLFGIALSVVVHLWRELLVTVRARFDDDTLTLEPMGVLFFASAPPLDDALIEQLAQHPEASRLVIDLKRLGRIDYTGALAIKSVADEARQAGMEVEIADVPTQSRRLLTRVLGPDSPYFR
jgi:SulP family sulfate permease